VAEQVRNTVRKRVSFAGAGDPQLRAKNVRSLTGNSTLHGAPLRKTERQKIELPTVPVRVDDAPAQHDHDSSIEAKYLPAALP